MYENTFPGKVHASIIFWSCLFFITFMWLHKSPRNSFITLGCNNLYENLGAQMAMIRLYSIGTFPNLTKLAD